MLCSKPLMVICFKYSSVCMSIPNSLTVPPPPSPAAMSSFSKSVSLSERPFLNMQKTLWPERLPFMKADVCGVRKKELPKAVILRNLTSGTYTKGLNTADPCSIERFKPKSKRRKGVKRKR